MTKWLLSFPYLAHVHFVHISPIFAWPEGEGFPLSPKETLNLYPNLSGKRQGHTWALPFLFLHEAVTINFQINLPLKDYESLSQNGI
jgi:hypothetical protein